MSYTCLKKVFSNTLTKKLTRFVLNVFSILLCYFLFQQNLTWFLINQQCQCVLVLILTRKLLFRVSIRNFLGKNFFNLCPSGLGNYIICRRFAFQKLTWSLKFVIHYKSGVREIVLGMTLTTKPSVSHTGLQSYELFLIQ